MFKEYCQQDISLRDYQQEAKAKIFGQWDCVDNILYQMPTGTGKTRLFTSIIRDISLASLKANKQCHILIIAHRTELIEQISTNLNKYRIPHGIIAGSAFKNLRNLLLPVQVASIQTITHPSNIEIVQAFKADFIIIDEAHHSIAKSYAKLWNYFPSSKKLGVTATPWRMDGSGFCNMYNTFIPSMSIKEFLAKGWLAPYDYYSVSSNSDIYQTVNAITEYGSDGDYKVQALENAVDIGNIRAQLLKSYFTYTKNKKGIIYSISRTHSKHICQQYRDAGLRIADIDSDTPQSQRKHLVNAFINGDLDIIVNVDIFSEGFDCPDIDFIQLARPTRSLVKYIQQIGRGLRKNGNNKCIILDNVGLYNQFGLPDDDRPWEQYFQGEVINLTQPAHSEISSSQSHIHSIRHFEEGDDEMTLIQEKPLSIDQIEIEVPSDQTLYQKEHIIHARSTRVFAHYFIEESDEGYFLVNERTCQRQFLLHALPPRSIVIKTYHTPNTSKCFTLISSFNRDSQPSKHDRIIGYLYREGKLLKFATSKKDKILNIRI
jgi:superfamily II DNA or RNA helicase